MNPSTHRVTYLLQQWGRGQAEALEELLPLVYEELRQLARGYMRRERPDHTLQTTALVHEAYLRLVGQDAIGWQSRTHFFGVAASVMRKILVNHAVRRRRAKRGGAGYKLSPTEGMEGSKEPAVDLEALDEALQRLAGLNARQSRLVELRYFGGLTVEETAEVLGISPATAKRDWTGAKAWLYRELEKGRRL